MATVNEIISGIESKMENPLLLCVWIWQACVLAVQLPLCWRRLWLITTVPRHL